jgi:hypothetical protein
MHLLFATKFLYTASVDPYDVAYMVNLGTIFLSFSMENTIEGLVSLTSLCSFREEGLIDHFKSHDVSIILFSMVGERSINHNTVHVYLVSVTFEVVHRCVLEDFAALLLFTLFWLHCH